MIILCEVYPFHVANVKSSIVRLRILFTNRLRENCFFDMCILFLSYFTCLVALRSDIYRMGTYKRLQDPGVPA